MRELKKRAYVARFLFGLIGTKIIVVVRRANLEGLIL